MHWVTQYVRQNPIVIGAVAALLILVVYLLSLGRISGSVSATVIGVDGSTRAVSLNLRDLTPSYYTFQEDVRRVLVAAVPSPQDTHAAFITRTRGGVDELSIGKSAGLETVPVSSGTLSDPRWSPEGSSIAFATKDETAEDLLSPEAWIVKRAVTHGDTLTVGRGYEPYPSPNQRTFALTSQGIALLAYSDTEPTVVVASPVPVPYTTPFAVSQDGMRVAWVAPADRSLQVFENVNGYFVPLLLEKTFIPQTMTFSPDGRYLLGTTHTEATTTLSVVTLTSGSVHALGDVPGFVRLHTWIYEK